MNSFDLNGVFKVLTLVTLIVYCAASPQHTKESVLELLSPKAQETVEYVGIAGGKAYFRDASNKSVDFAGFVQFCQVNSMRTASVMTFEENEVLRNYFSDTGYWSLFWLGGWDINDEGNFNWLDTNKPFNYTSWYYSSGPSGSRYGNCVYMTRSGGWMVKNCEESTGGVVSLCELQLI